MPQWDTLQPTSLSFGILSPRQPGSLGQLTQHPCLTPGEPIDPPFKVTWCRGSTEPGGTWHVGGPTLQGAFPAYLLYPGAVAPPGEVPPGGCGPQQTGHSWAVAKGVWTLKLGAAPAHWLCSGWSLLKVALLKVALPDLAESGVSARICTCKGEARLNTKGNRREGFP